jgi:DNA-binding PadR family transcriptional regulator
MKQIKERTDGEMSLGPATMYRSLQGLEDKQLIKKLGKPAHAKKLRRDIYNYQITGQGCAAAEAELFRLAKMVDRAAKTLFQETSDTLWSGLQRLMREWKDTG